jgi:hypothetical protein
MKTARSDIVLSLKIVHKHLAPNIEVIKYTNYINKYTSLVHKLYKQIYRSKKKRKKKERKVDIH